MTILKVGPSDPYPTIADAVAAAAEGDTIRMVRQYTYSYAVLTVENLTVSVVHGAFINTLWLGVGIHDVTLDGRANNFYVIDNTGSNTITGSERDDQVHLSGGTDVVHGGDGYDRLYVSYRSATSVVASAGSVTDSEGNSATYDAVEYVSISTGSGDNSLTADDGNYLLISGGGDDTITAHRADVDAGPGNDTIHIVDSGNVGGGSGNDTVTTGDGDSYVGGGAGDDTVTTGAGDDHVGGGHGNDTLKTGSGDDTVYFDGGIDTADAAAGHDLLFLALYGLQANVTVSISAGSAAEGYSGLASNTNGNHSVSFTGIEHFEIYTGAGDDDVRIGAGNDTVRSGDGDDFVSGGAGNDALRGDRGADTIRGGPGDDGLAGDGYFPEMFGGGGAADILIGGRGDDLLSGAYGADTLIGGRGADTLQGWLGADVFLFDDLDSTVGASDVIDDLEARDTINLSRIDADTTSEGNQAFNFVATLSGTAGEATLRYQAGDRTTRLILDTDGDARADIRIIAKGDHSDFSNFVL
jgi:Ca2+-binding RTX toxin-like protein